MLADMTTFGERVKQRRLDLGISQGELARRADISQQAITKIERKGKGSKYTTKIAAALNVSPEWLESGQDIPRKTFLKIPLSNWNNDLSIIENKEFILKENYIYLKVLDDSMVSIKGASFPSGSIIIADPNIKPQVNKFVLATHKQTGKILFRQYSDLGVHLKLVPMNPIYDIFHLDDVNILGVVVASINLDL